jgi:hypothetical protein
MTLALIRNSALSAALAAVLVSLLVFASFLMFEPKVGQGAVDTDEFEITQTVTEEISFIATSSDVVMSPSLAGITGGTSNGSYTVRVRTNNATGYNMTIDFSSTTAMTRDGGGGYISNYAPASTTNPDYTFANETFAQFAYTVTASTTTDIDQSFLDNGSNACGTGSTAGTATCWFNPSTTPETIINRNTSTAASGATTTIQFRVNIPSNPIPAIQTGTYTATATLTATTN